MIARNDILKVAFFLLLSIPAFTEPVYAQLISPGKLSEVHKNLEGVTNCTSCHALGNKGISNERCLNCHTPLKAEIEKMLGYHANASVINQNCANCHKEHFGRTFEILKWDTSKFDHDETGYTLIGKHRNISCTGCHNRKFITARDVIKFKGEHNALNHTFLGLDTNCSTCHEADSPHGNQFAGKDCQNCHTSFNWKDLTAFNHNNARFKLLGKHIDVSCKSCHQSVTLANNKTIVRYTDLKFGRCLDCHDDPHNGAMGTQCKNCHSVQGWNKLANFSEKTFDHNTTGYPLLGKHKTVACVSCHNPKSSVAGIQRTFVRSTLGFSYPHPKSDRCVSCHEDYHNGAFGNVKGGIDCANCHTVDGWLPTSFDIKRHNQESRFALTGAHLAIPCNQCHQSPNQKNYTFHFNSLDCQTCHDTDNPHGDEFKDASGKTVCANCHDTNSWTAKITFDHRKTKFPLTGAHQLIACSSCHQTDKNVHIDFTLQSGGLPLDCEGCHAKDDPHHGQFAQSAIGSNCDDCHNTDSFTMKNFDHSRTRFPLEGAHADVACVSCHKTETGSDGKQFIRFRPMKITCESCHANKN
ncbi:MAG TPA: hypothetical protein VJ964_13755 [Balneolaceae bacterium]|nr:hypothetical protein [Balneolaceae bacterium]